MKKFTNSGQFGQRPPWNKGKKTGQQVWNKGKKLPPSWNKGIPMREESKIKLRAINLGKKDSLETRLKKKASARLGRTNGNWRGGTTPLGKKIRASFEYKLWREAVFKRDNYTCVWCKVKGVYLHADHIKPFALYPELRFDIANGRTLCVPCHKTTDTYLYKLRWVKS